MKTKNYLILLSLLCATSLPGLSADYSITFIGSGAAETVESVDVFNVNTGETKTVQGGGTLVLTPTPEGIEQIGNENGNLRVFGADGKTIVTFQAKQQGDAVVEVFGLDGKKMTGLKQNVSAGENTFSWWGGIWPTETCPAMSFSRHSMYRRGWRVWISMTSP